MPKKKKPTAQRLMTFPQRLAKRIVSFLSDWLKTRHWVGFAAGLPAITVAIVLVITLFRNQSVDAETTAKSYVLASQAAIDAEEYAQAELLLRKLLVLQPNEESHKYHMAICWENLNNRSRARSIMSRIAPDDETGYAPAHFWMAKYLSKVRTANDSSQTKLLEHHLKSASSDKRFQASINRQLAMLYTRQGRFDLAVKSFQSIKIRGPQYWMTLAKLHASNGSFAKARQAANNAYNDLDRRLSEDSTQKQLWSPYLEIALRLEKFDEAIEKLEAAKEKAKTRTEKMTFDHGISLAYCGKFDATPNSQPKQRLELIDQAMSYSPNSSHVLTRLSQIVAASGESAEKFQSLNNALVEGRAPVAVHFILGTAALQKEEFQKAQTHFEIVLRNKPRHVASLNNMAWSLAHNSKPDLNQALEYANKTLKLAPNDVRFLDTRARILEKTGDVKGAISDFEAIIKSDPENQFALERLAELYETAGLSDLAKGVRKKLLETGDDAKNIQQPPAIPDE